MICLLHGYLLDGSGSNLWTRSIVESLCRIGETVHLVCQEAHPEAYPFVAEARAYHPDGRVDTLLARETGLPGRCVLHKPLLGPVLPVYVTDRYEEFERVVPMVELPDAEIEEYLERNVRVVRRVVAEHPVHAIHANHAVLMPQVAQRVSEETAVPFAVMPHGSAIEYAVKRDERFRRRAARSFIAADRIFVIGPEMRTRVRDVFHDLDGIEARMTDLNLGVDTRRFQPIPADQRAASIRELGRSLEGIERGRTPAARAALIEALDHPHAALDDLLVEPPGDPKRPDAGLEDALAAIDWGDDPVLLFLGRLIAAKGPHAVIAAFPRVLHRHPRARLVIVGHGPLRVPLEAMTHALATGDRALFEALIRPGIPGAETGMVEVRAFLDAMSERERDAYFERAAERLDESAVVFAGYLRHAQLRHLFPCCDAAVFPSVVKEAGPLVFLEALSCGTLPMGTDFGGMRESLNALGDILPSTVLDALRLSPDPVRLVADIARAAPAALDAAPRHGPALRELAVRRYDWTSVAERFSSTLQSTA